MGTRKSHEEVKISFENEGYILLTENYINNKQKLEYLCPKGHRYSITFHNWLRGNRCAVCAGLAKKTIEEVRNSFKEEGYTLLTNKYLNSKQKLEYICPEGHKHSIRWNSWQLGQRCGICFGTLPPSLEEIKKSFEEEGYKLLSTIYKNTKTKLEFICSQGHIHKIAWDSWQQGQRCGKCFGSEKYTYKKVKEDFEREGYTLLSKEYKNVFNKLEYICPQGHNYYTIFTRWIRGHRCPYCSGNGKPPIEEVRKSFESEGYILLTEVYKNNRQNLKFICPKGHEHFISYNNWLSGQRCGICYQNRINIPLIQEEIKKENYSLLSDVYKNAFDKLKFKCPEGHTFTMSWGNWQSGYRCKTCSIINRTLSFEFVKKSFEGYGYTLLSESYKDAFTYLKSLCPKEHIYYTKWNNWQQGCRCNICSKHASKGEQEISDFIKSLFPNSEQRVRNIIPPQELDILIPTKNLAIEYCGLYWHSENRGKDKNYHLNKLEQCQERGIKLITIFEDEWIHKQKIVESRLKQILNCFNNEKIYARNCAIGEIDTKTKDIFLEGNHLQGKDSSSIRLGAFFDGELVSVMTFSKGNIAKGSSSKEGVYELSRFCSISDYRVVGIASKLLTYFIKGFKPKEVFSYADRRWSDGNLYKKLDFKLEHYTQPNYWYIQKDKRIHRFNFRKSELSKKLDNFDSTLTEWENMQNNGYDRIWDCGNIKFIRSA
uniref:Putative Hef-like homing endonuclease n=1 Tax=viral metagenome TaxID=1070528 RepID=A0A6M3L0P6_9ZZZZ